MAYPSRQVKRALNITTGNINSLIAWFERDRNPVKFLCLLVAGHLNDAKFFADVFDNQEALDTISGEDIAIFLFANEQEGMLTVEVRDGESKALPGQILLPKRLRGLWYEHISAFHKDKIRDDVIRASQNVSGDICRQFRLDYNDIPCIFLLGKGDPLPFIIPTKGEADVNEFYNFLKEFRGIAATIPTTYDLNWPMSAVKRIIAEEKETSEKTSLAEAESELQASLNLMYDVLERYGMPHSVCEELINAKTASRVWEKVGLRRDLPQTPLLLEYSEVFRKAFEEADLRERAREVGRSARNVAQAKKRLVASEKRIKELKSIKARLDITVASFVTAREAINKLCEKFERKFVWKARYRPIKQFAEAFLGISKKTNDLLSLQETIKKLIIP